MDEPATAESTVECFWIGDSRVGKTSILWTYTTGEFPTEEEFLPSVFDKKKPITVDGAEVTAHLVELPSSEDFDKLRSEHYCNANVVVICFSLAGRTSFDSVTEKWYPEVHNSVPDMPIVLVGMKKDLRHQTEKEAADKSRRYAVDAAKKKLKTNYVSIKQGTKLARTVSAKRYLECSSLTGDNVQGVIEEVARVGWCVKTGRNCNEATVSSPCRVL